MKALQIKQDARDKVHERSGYLCEKCGQRRAEEVHHRLGKGMGGSRLPWVHMAGALLHLCGQCHEEVTNTRGLRELCETNGWIVSRRSGKRPTDVPVVLHYGFVLLDNVGGWREWTP